MKIRISIAHPTTRVDSSPLNPATDLSRFVVYYKKDADPFTQLGGDHSPSITQLDTPDLPYGSYTVRVEWYDNFGQSVGINKSFEHAAPATPAAPSPGDFSMTTVA